MTVWRRSSAYKPIPGGTERIGAFARRRGGVEGGDAKPAMKSAGLLENLRRVNGT